MIARIWRGITLHEQADAYLEHLHDTALPALRGQSGLHDVLVLHRVQGEHCEFQLITLWDDLDAMRTWAGEDPMRAVYFDEDDNYLLDMESLVRIYDVAHPPSADED